MSKSPQAFRSISEAAEEVGVPQHVLRFWETKFDLVAPVKRAGGRRFYRPDDIEVLKTIRRLLHDEGMTIKGVQKVFRDRAKIRVPAMMQTPDIDTSPASASAQTGSSRLDVARLCALLAQIEAAQARLQTALRR